MNGSGGSLRAASCHQLPILTVNTGSMAVTHLGNDGSQPGAGAAA